MRSCDWSLLFTFLYFMAISILFNLSGLQPYTYYPSNRSRSLFYTSIARRSRMPTPGDGTEPFLTDASVAGTSNPGSPVINEAFSLFKSSVWGTLFPSLSLRSACDSPMLRCTCFADINNLRSFELSDHNNYLFLGCDWRINCRILL